MALVLLLLRAATAYGDEFTVREVEPGLQTGWSKELRIASSERGALAVWKTSRLLAARIGAGGEVLDRVALEISLSSFLLVPAVVASDGTDYLVAHGGYPLQLTRISAETGQMTPLPKWTPTNDLPLRLSWNGRARAWLLQFNRNYREYSVLLDRDGAVISGTLQHRKSTVESVASHAGSWLLAGRAFGQYEAVAGILTTRDFPPPGEERPLVLPVLFPSIVDIAVAADRDGYVSVRSYGYPQKTSIVLQRLAVADHLPDRRFGALPSNVEPAGEPVVIAEHVYGALVSLAVDGGSAIVTYDNRRDGPTPHLALIEGSHVTQHYSLRAVESQVAFTSYGPLAVAVTPSDGQVRVVYPATGELVSRGYQSFHAPELIAGGGAHLASWSERRDLQVATYFRILDGNGRPVAPPVLFDSSWASQARRLGFSGRTFLIVFGHSALQVSLDGTILNRAVLPDTDDVHRSLTWRDGRYFLTGGTSVLRLAEDGTPLDPAPVDLQLGGEYLYLAANEDGFVAVTRALDRMPCTCPVNADTSVYLLDPDLRRRRMKYSGYGHAGLFALAAGGEDYLFVWEDDLYATPIVHRLFTRAAEQRPDYGGQHVALEAVWTGNGFLVRAGTRVAQHTPYGELLRIGELGEDALESAISASGVVLSIRQRPADANVIVASRPLP